MKRTFRTRGCIASCVRFATRLLLAASLAAWPSFAFEIPLSDNAIRQAYFLGQRTDQKSADFLGLYRRALPLPNKGPYVSEILLLTPYAQVVATSNRHTVGYSAQQAAADYHGRGDTILVQIRIELTSTFTYSDATRSAQDVAGKLNRHFDPEDFWRAFHIDVLQITDSQDEKVFEPFDVSAEPIYSHSSGQYIGAFVSLEFDASQFDSIPTHVELTAPTGQRAVAEFDLRSLR